jgi:dolichol-phosphate mannosyltransferase
MPKQLSIVVPVYNEADNILPLLAEIQAAMAFLRLDHEVILVDDASEDDTHIRLEEALAKYDTLRVLRHVARRGQSAALYTGVAAARGTWIATLDGDGQNDPADIPRLWQMLQSIGTDLTSRVLVGWRQRRRDTWVKRRSSRIANAVRARLLGDHTPDTGCGLKLFPRAAFLALPAFDHMHRFLPALFQRAGLEVHSVTVNHRPRLRGTSKYGIGNRLWVGIADLIGVMWLQRRSLRVVSIERAAQTAMPISQQHHS